MRVWYPRCCRNQASKSASSRMVTTVFRVGHTTLASFQNRSSVARTSGSDAMPRRIWASLMWRSLFQFVRPPRLAFDVLPVGASFVRFRPPRRDDAPFVIVFIRVNHRNFQAVHQANRNRLGFRRSRNGRQPFRPWARRRSAPHPRRRSHAGWYCGGSSLGPNYRHQLYLHNVNIYRTAAVGLTPEQLQYGSGVHAAPKEARGLTFRARKSSTLDSYSGRAALYVVS